MLIEIITMFIKITLKMLLKCWSVMLKEVVNEEIIKESEDPKKRKKEFVKKENLTSTARSHIQYSLKRLHMKKIRVKQK